MVSAYLQSWQMISCYHFGLTTHPWCGAFHPPRLKTCSSVPILTAQHISLIFGRLRPQTLDPFTLLLATVHAYHCPHVDKATCSKSTSGSLLSLPKWPKLFVLLALQ